MKVGGCYVSRARVAVVIAALEQRGLETGGSKTELVARLEEAMIADEAAVAWTRKYTTVAVVFDKEAPLGLSIVSVSQDSHGSGCPAHVMVNGFYGDSELFWQESNIKLCDVLWKVDGQDVSTSPEEVRG